MDQQPESPITLFYSYAREDEALRNRLEKHLSLLQRRGLITAWHDRQIMPGADWSHAIDTYLSKSSIILLLISPDFLASSYCYNTEMQHALERHRKGEAYVIPVLLRPVDWQDAPFAHLQCLPRNAKPVTEWTNRDAAFRDISEGLRHTIEQLFHSLEGGKAEQNEAMNSRIKYLKHLMYRYSTVTLPLGPVEGFSLQAIFQPLTLRRDPLVAEDLPQEKRHTLIDKSVPEDDQLLIVAKTSEEALEKSPQKRLVILGGPGTGKTTVLQTLIYEQALKAFKDPGASLPIMVSLPDLARSGKILEEYIFHLAREVGLQDQFITTFRKAIEEGQAFICLDSLDEVSPGHRPEIIRIINELAAGTSNTWVIGSRFTDYKGGQFKRGGFTEWELQPLTSSLRQELAKRLLPELYRLLQPHLDQTGDEPFAFTNLLEMHTQAAVWGENPLLFSLAAVLFVRLGTLPMNRVILYKQVVDAVLEMREKDPTRRKVLRRALADLALTLYITKGRAFSLDDLLFLLPIIRQRQLENWTTEEMAQRIITSGMLDVLAYDTYGFRHQTFQEYLAAMELAQGLVNRDQTLHDETWAFIWSKRTYSRWTEILRLMVGVLGKDYRNQGVRQAVHWLQALENQQHTPEGDPGDLGIALAIKSLSEITGSETPQSWDIAGGPTIERKLASDWVDNFLHIVRHGSWPQQHRLEQLVPDICSLSSPAVRMVVQPLLAALSDANYHRRYAVANILGNLGKQTPVEELLAAVASPNRDLSYAASSVLEHHMKSVPVALLATAVNNEQPIVRRTALTVLGNLGSQAPLEPLIAKLNDKDASVRAAAVRALGNLGSQAPLEPLMSALKDNEISVRCAALTSLGMLGERAPLEVLVAAFQENNYSIRGSAVWALINLGERTPTEVLLTILRNGEGTQRGDAAKALGDRRAKIAFETLVEALQKPRETFERTQIEAARALGKLGTPAAIPPLVAALRSANDEGIEEAATEALGELGDHAPIEPLVEALDNYSQKVRIAAIRALGKLGARAPIEPLVKTLLNRQRRWSPSTNGRRERGPAELDISQIDEDDENEDYDSPRAAAAEVLGRLGSRAPVEPLLTVLGDPDERVRVAVTRALSMRVGVTSLLNQLNEHNSAARLAALQVLISLKDQIPIQPLLVALQDNDSKIRLVAVQTLEELDPQISINLLLTALHDDVQEVRRAAAMVVDKFGAQVPKEPLVEALQDASFEVRTVAARALSRLGKATPIDALLEALHDSRNDKFGQARRAAGNALGTLGEQLPIEAILAALNDRDVYVRAASVQALRGLGEHTPVEPLIALLRTKNEGNLIHSPQVLKALKEGDSQSFWAIFDEYVVRIAAIEALGALGERAPIEPLLDILRDDGPNERAAAAKALGFLGNRAPVELLIAALNDKVASVRAAAAEALGNLRSPLSAEPLMVMLHESELDSDFPSKWEIQEAIIQALGALGENAPIESLVAALNDKNWEVSERAARVLGKLGEKAPGEAILAAALNDKGGWPSVAADAMRRRGEQIPQNLLLAALGHHNEILRAAAAEVLGQFGDRAPLEALLAALHDPKWEVREGAIRTLGNLGERTSGDNLVAALGDSHDWVRAAAALALGKLGRPALIGPLITALRDQQWFVRIAAARALGQLGEYVPVEPLIATLGDGYWQVRVAACEALGQLGMNTPVEPLLKATGDSNFNVRRAAIEALRKSQPAALSPVVQEATQILLKHEASTILGSLTQGFKAEVIGNIGYPMAELLDTLTDLLSWPYWEVRMKAALALGQLRRNIPDKAIRSLLDLRHDPESRAVQIIVEEVLADILSLETGIEDDW